MLAKSREHAVGVGATLVVLGPRDLAALATLELVVADGRPYPRDALDRALEAQRAHARGRLNEWFTDAMVQAASWLANKMPASPMHIDGRKRDRSAMSSLQASIEPAHRFGGYRRELERPGPERVPRPGTEP